MTTSLRRAGAFALVASLSLTAPVLGRAAVVPFALVAIVALATTDGTLFELFALPADREVGRLAGLAGFSLGAVGVGLLTVAMAMPLTVFVATVLLVGYGELGAQAARRVRDEPLVGVTGFLAAGLAVGVLGQLGVGRAAGIEGATLPVVVFLAAAGVTLAGLLRSVLVARQDPVVVVAVGLFLWLFADLQLTVDAEGIAIALAVTAALGYVSWALGTASIPGMLTGVLLSLLTVVLGGYGWFLILVVFFALGGLASKFRYDAKVERGVAEPRGGARGSGNVLGNAAPALFAVVLFAAHGRLSIPEAAFRFAFAGSLATALGDTLSSEIGGLYDAPRMVTTLRRVEPGTDGAVTWQGELAGVVGAGLVGGLSLVLFPVAPTGAAVVVLAGVVGMTVDSLLGATVEGTWIGNQSVNFLATAAGAVAGGGLALAAGLV